MDGGQYLSSGWSTEVDRRLLNPNQRHGPSSTGKGIEESQSLGKSIKRQKIIRTCEYAEAEGEVLFRLCLYSSPEKTPTKLVVDAQECPVLPNLNKTSRPFIKGMDDSNRQESVTTQTTIFSSSQAGRAHFGTPTRFPSGFYHVDPAVRYSVPYFRNSGQDFIPFSFGTGDGTPLPAAQATITALQIGHDTRPSLAKPIARP